MKFFGKHMSRKYEKSYGRLKFSMFNHRFWRFGLPKWSSRCVESIKLAIWHRSMSRKCFFLEHLLKSYGPEKSGAENFRSEKFQKVPKRRYFRHLVRIRFVQILRFPLFFDTKSFLSCSDFFEMLAQSPFQKCQQNGILSRQL